MKKPTPIDLLIEPDTSPLLSETIRIEAHTEEARRWIEENAKEFGALYCDPLQEGSRVKWALWIYRAFDRAQVIEYLICAWDSSRWPVDIEAEAKAE